MFRFLKRGSIVRICVLQLGSLLITFASFAQADSATYFFNKGMEEKAARRWREAEKNFTRVYQLQPGNYDNLIALAGVLMEQRRVTEAFDKFVAADKLRPGEAESTGRLMDLSYNLRKYDEAIQYANALQKIKPGAGAYLLIAKCYYAKEQYGDVVKYSELAFKDDPKNAEIPYIAGRAFMDMNNYRRAAGCFEQAIALDSSNSTWMYEAGLAWYAVPDDKKSLYWIEKAGQKGYKRTSDYIENLASAYLNAGQFEKGIEMLKEVLQRKPQDPELIYSIAEAYYKIKKYDEAITYWDQNLALDKKNANALYMIGMCYQKKGDKEKGQQLCDKAIEMDPSLKKLKEERKMPDGL